MHCPICNYSRPGDASSCARCDHKFVTSTATTRQLPVSEPFVRTIFYLLVFFALAEGFRRLCADYLSADQIFKESTLQKLALERRLQLQEVSE